MVSTTWQGSEYKGEGMAHDPHMMYMYRSPDKQQVAPHKYKHPMNISTHGCSLQWVQHCVCRGQRLIHGRQSSADRTCPEEKEDEECDGSRDHVDAPTAQGRVAHGNTNPNLHYHEPQHLRQFCREDHTHVGSDNIQLINPLPIIINS